MCKLDGLESLSLFGFRQALPAVGPRALAARARNLFFAPRDVKKRGAEVVRFISRRPLAGVNAPIFAASQEAEEEVRQRGSSSRALLKDLERKFTGSRDPTWCARKSL